MVNRLLPRYRDRRLKGDDFDEFVEHVLESLPKGISRKTLLDSIRHLVGQKLTAHLLDETCWRLAGNVKRLKQTRAVAPWTGQKHPEWVPVQIQKVRLQLGGRRGTEIGHEVSFRVVAGTSCPLIITQWWSRKKSRYLAQFKDEQGNGFGFIRAWPNQPTPYEFKDPKQLVTLRCLLLIEPKLCDSEGPNFHEIAHSSGTTKWNKEQQKFRARLEAPYLCCKEMPADIPCHQCPVGLDTCRASTHARTHEWRVCPQCKEEAWHDPADKIHGICVGCVEYNIFHDDEDED
jgi:hypothetical protein